MADTKDWTWTLERVCSECGFDAGVVPAATAALEGGLTALRAALHP